MIKYYILVNFENNRLPFTLKENNSLQAENVGPVSHNYVKMTVQTATNENGVLHVSTVNTITKNRQTPKYYSFLDLAKDQAESIKKEFND